MCGNQYTTFFHAAENKRSCSMTKNGVVKMLWSAKNKRTFGQNTIIPSSSSLSIRSFARCGFAIANSVYGLARFGSQLSILGYTQLGSSISIRSFARFGSAISIYGIGRFGSALSILDACCFGSALSIRSYTRMGSSLSCYGAARLGSTWAGSGRYRKGPQNLLSSQFYFSLPY